MNEPLIALGSQKIHLWKLEPMLVKSKRVANCEAACPNKIKLNLRV